MRVRRPSQVNQQLVSPLPPPRTPSALRFLPGLLVALGGAFFAGRVTAPRAADPVQDDGAVGSSEASGESPAAGSAASRIAERMRALQPRSGAARSGSAPVGMEAIELLNRLPSSEQREDERLRIIEQWAATAPEAALDYVRQNLRGDRQLQGISKVVTIWARRAPAPAWQWIRKQGAGDGQTARLVMEEIAKSSPAVGARFALDFARQEPQEASAMAMAAIRGMTFEGSFDTAHRFVADLRLPSTDDQVAVNNYLAAQWARHDPDQALAWARSLPEGTVRDQVMVGVGESWAQSDPARAAVTADQLPAGQARQVALRQAVSQWSLSDPGAANEWVSHAQPSPDFDQVVASLATQRSMMQQHTDMALNWATAIGDPSLKLSTLREVVSDWATRDRNATLDYIQSSRKLSEDTRAALLAHLGVQ